MLVRYTTLACLALLCACGSNESDTSKSATKPTAAVKTPPAAPTTPPPATTPKPIKVTPTEPPAESKVAIESKPAVTPPPVEVTPPQEDTAPGIVHTTPTEPLPGSDTAKAEPPYDDSELTALPGETPAAPAPASATAAADRAVAHLAAASGSAVTGTVTFVRQATGVEVHIELQGLTPGEHGLHIHETGDCSASDALTAGDHFNPGNAPHGGRDMPQRHAGDLGNVVADAAGKVDVTFTDLMLTLSGENSILGRAVIVHADKDDLSSQPAGNSGARIACGVIEEQKAGGSQAGGG